MYSGETRAVRVGCVSMAVFSRFVRADRVVRARFVVRRRWFVRVWAVEMRVCQGRFSEDDILRRRFLR